MKTMMVSLSALLKRTVVGERQETISAFMLAGVLRELFQTQTASSSSFCFSIEIETNVPPLTGPEEGIDSTLSMRGLDLYKYRSSFDRKLPSATIWTGTVSPIVCGDGQSMDDEVVAVPSTDVRPNEQW